MSKVDSPADTNRVYIFLDVIDGGKSYKIADPWFQAKDLMANAGKEFE
jgi:hypothetical protein